MSETENEAQRAFREQNEEIEEFDADRANEELYGENAWRKYNYDSESD